MSEALDMADKYLKELHAFQVDRTAASALKRQRQERARGLFNQARELLRTRGGHTLYTVYVGTHGGGASTFEARWVTEVVIPHSFDDDTKGEIVLANTSGETVHGVDRGVVSLYLRKPEPEIPDGTAEIVLGPERTPLYDPGNLLFTIWDTGEIEGPETRLEIINAILAKFDPATAA